MDCSKPGFPIHHQLLELSQTHVHRVSDAIQPSHPVLLPSPAFSLSQHQGLFQGVSSSYQVAKVLEFQLQHRSFHRLFKTDFFRIDWFDLLVDQGTVNSLLQHHSSKASILRCSAFFIVQLSHPYMTSLMDPKFPFLALLENSFLRTAIMSNKSCGQTSYMGIMTSVCSYK